MLTQFFAQLLTVAQALSGQSTQHSYLVLAYLGPQTVLPIASFLAAGIGIILMFGRYIMAIVRKGMQAFKRDTGVVAPVETQDDVKS